jgi:hypothetical protein
MSHYRPILVLPVVAAGAIASNRFVTAARQQTGADGNALGVSLNAAASGEPLPIVSLGTAPVEAGAAVTAGATVKSDSSGRAIAWATSGARLGVALTAATAAGQLIEVSLIPNAA